MNEVQLLEESAFHEAAHARLHLAMRHPVQEIAVSDSGGHCLLADTAQRFNVARLAERESLLTTAICACAGRFGVVLASGQEEDVGDSDDRERALRCCVALSDGDKIAGEILLRWCQRRAQLLVKKHAADIHRIAFRLLDTTDNDGVGRLNGTQIRKALHERD